MAKSKRPVSMTDQLRALIRESGVTSYQIAKATGVSNATLSRFLSGERGLSCEAMDAIAEYFGWQVIASGRKPEPKGR